MISTRNLVVFISLALLSMSLIHAQDLSSYRGFQLGTDLAATATQAGMKAAEAKVVYQRPAVIQELEWRTQSLYGSSTQTDPVKGILFSFYSDELYRLVVNYDPDRTEGLTDKDLIESISAQYGKPTTPVEKITSSSSAQVYSSSEKVIARWEDSQCSYNLFRSSYGSVPGLLIFSKRLEALAQVAIVQAIRLNELEAPQREIDRQKKQAEEKNAAGQKARTANMVNFRP
jgi:hypothetical protein